MPKIEALKCPNCGASVQGTGQVVCPYCNSALDVTGPDKVALNRVKTQYGAAGRTISTGQKARFNALPDLDVTPQTKEVPFRPTLIYGGIPGGRPDPARQADANAIVAAVETTHRAINKEDLDLYMSTISPESAAFYEQAKVAAVKQFVENDMKRFTTTINFRRLTADAAEVDTTIEALIFFPQGFTNHVVATFRGKWRKTAAGWKVVGSRVKSKKLIGGCGMAVALIGPAVGLVVGIGAAVAAVITKCDKSGKEGAAETQAPAVAVETSPAGEAGQAEGAPAKPDFEGYYAAKSGIPLYRAPNYGGSVTTVITPGTRYKILAQRKEWYRIRSEDGATGWVPEAVMELNPH